MLKVIEVFMEQKNNYNLEELISCAKGEMFGEGNPQLPMPPMLMFDRITKITENGGDNGKGLVIAELDIKPDLWFFDCHFINDPVMPGCLGLDAMWQLLGFYLGWLGLEGKGRALSVGGVKFSGMVLPVTKEINSSLSMTPLPSTSAKFINIFNSLLVRSGSIFFSTL